MKKEINLTKSEINTLIAGMLICSVKYDILKNKSEAEKYMELEYKLRELFYHGDEIAEGTIISNF